MQPVRRLRGGRSSRVRRLVPIVCLIGAILFLFLLASPPSSRWMRAPVPLSAWGGALRGPNVDFCAGRLRPRLTPENGAVSSVYALGDALSGDAAASGALAHRVGEVYDVDVAVGQLKVGPGFRARALSMFPALKGDTDGAKLRLLEKQPVVTVRNLHTHDMTYFNAIRRFRPGAEATLAPADEASITELYTAGATADDCDFCSVSRTAEDVFGRLEGPRAYTAANVAKLSRWHSVIVARAHNPLAFDVAVIEEMFNHSIAWFHEVARRDPAYRFGNIICDIGKRASASQVHLHFQVWATKGAFAAGFQKTVGAARAFEAATGRSYWAAWLEAHAAANLVVPVGTAFTFPHLSPAKEKEIVVMAPALSADFGRAAALAMVALRDGGQSRSMSFGAALPFPPAGSPVDAPALLRVIDRGNPLDLRGDTGGLEYFTSPYVGSDPYQVAEWLRRSAAAHKIAQ